MMTNQTQRAELKAFLAASEALFDGLRRAAPGKRSLMSALGNLEIDSSASPDGWSASVKLASPSGAALFIARRSLAILPQREGPDMVGGKADSFAFAGRKVGASQLAALAAALPLRDAFESALLEISGFPGEMPDADFSAALAAARAAGG